MACFYTLSGMLYNVSRYVKLLHVAISLLIAGNYCLAQTWSTLGNGMVGGYVNTICVYDSNIYAAGTFIAPGSHIAEWNGTSWTGVGGGINNDIYTLCSYENSLYAGGYFSEAGGHSAGGFAEWNQVTWSPVDAKFQHTITTFDTINDQLFYSDYDKGVYAWNGVAFQAVLFGMQCNSIVSYNDTVYIAGITKTPPGGYFFKYEACLYKVWLKAGTYAFKLIGKFHSSTNSADIYSLSVYNNELYIGGTFDTVNKKIIHNLAVYDGNSIRAMAGNINGIVNALTEYNGKLYAGGHFDSVGLVPANNIACWNDTVWTALGQGVNNEVFCMVPFNGELYVGGGFTSPGYYIAKYNSNSVAEVKNFEAVTIYPNPNNGAFNIGVPKTMNNSRIVIYNILGQEISRFNLNNTINEVNIEGNSAGVYVYKIETSGGEKQAAGRFIIYSTPH